MEFPPLLSNRQVAEILGIKRTSMPHQRKVKGFPQPVVIIDKSPAWLESDIVTWVEWRNKFKGATKNED